MNERQQLSEISRVKNHIHGLIQEPIKVLPDQTIGDIIQMIEQKGLHSAHSQWLMKRESWSGFYPGTLLNTDMQKIKFAR
jgi:IMP dehydrogenase